MIQEEKQLLLKDLCARLPYGVEIICEASNISLTLSPHMLQEIWNDGNELQWKPYLRPMSSITEKENEELGNCITIYEMMDIMLSHHLDCHELIPKHLALEAPEGMYKIG